MGFSSNNHRFYLIDNRETADKVGRVVDMLFNNKVPKCILHNFEKERGTYLSPAASIPLKSYS